MASKSLTRALLLLVAVGLVAWGGVRLSDGDRRCSSSAGTGETLCAGCPLMPTATVETATPAPACDGCVETAAAPCADGCVAKQTSCEGKSCPPKADAAPCVNNCPAPPEKACEG